MDELLGTTVVTADVPAQKVLVDTERRSVGASAQPMPPTTTLQQDMVVAGQRHINVMWEGTQRNIALVTTSAVVIVCMYLIVAGTPELRLAAFTFLTTSASTISQNYFTRTNHTKIGGVGSNDSGR